MSDEILFWAIVGGWVACFAFNYWAMWSAEKKRKIVTNGDVVFIMFICVMGPIGLGAALSALSDGALEKWANKPAWKRDDNE